jgi:carbamoyl-phosphate synthase/aspartate carbamoyltransferase/dihydroorotase
MRPTLGTAADRAALWANLDVVDCIASDHAPHTRQEKSSAHPPPGVPGLETTLPLLLTAVHEGRLTIEQVMSLLYDGPRRVYHLPAQPETVVEVDPEATYVIDEAQLETKCGWSPFAGMRVRGRVRRVTLRGKTAYEGSA